MKQLNTTKLTKGGKSMEKEYDIEKLNPRKNPYAKRVKKQITINIDGDTIDFFKAKSEKCGIPYQTLINLYLSDCKEQNRELELKCPTLYNRLNRNVGNTDIPVCLL